MKLTIRLLAGFALLIGLIGLLSLQGSPSASGQTDPSPTPAPDPDENVSGEELERSQEPVSDEQALQTDIDLMQKANPDAQPKMLEEVLRLRNEVAVITGELGTDEVAWIEWSDQLSADGFVALKGEGNADAVARLERAGVTVITGAKLSLSEQGMRAEAVSAAIRAIGFRESRVYPSDTDGKLVIEVPFGSEPDAEAIETILLRAEAEADKIALRPGVAPPGAASIQANPTRFSAVARQIEVSDLVFREVDRASLTVDETTIRGGQYHWSSDGACTSGWSMTWYGYSGYVTAGHCVDSGPVQLYDPAGVWDHSWWVWEYASMDVGIVLSNSATSTSFYADDTQLRTQGAVVIAGVNDPVCVFGRTSNIRLCNNRFVTNLNECNSAGACYLSRVSIGFGRSICKGDSGGGISFGTNLQGIQISAGPAGANDDCNANLSTNYTYEQFQPMHQIRDWLGVQPN